MSDFTQLTDLFTGSAGDITIGSTVIAVAAALILGLVLGLIYLKASGGRYAASLLFTLIVLPAIVCAVIILVGSNIARAFSMAGVFSLIRFRSEPGQPKDLAYIFLATAIGLACGLSLVLYAVLFTVMIGLVMLILSLLKVGAPVLGHMSLKITVPEDLDFNDAFDDILERYTAAHTFKKLRTADLGTVFELTYDVVPVRDLDEKAFLNELRCRNGNMNIVLTLAE